jgi:hypothetical protein
MALGNMAQAPRRARLRARAQAPPLRGEYGGQLEFDVGNLMAFGPAPLDTA